MHAYGDYVICKDGLGVESGFAFVFISLRTCYNNGVFPLFLSIFFMIRCVILFSMPLSFYLYYIEQGRRLQNPNTRVKIILDEGDP